MLKIGKKVAVIGAILETPEICQTDFNYIVSQYKSIIKGRMGIPFDGVNVSVIAITVCGTLDEINGLTGKLGNVNGVTVKTAFSKKDFDL